MNETLLHIENLSAGYQIRRQPDHIVVQPFTESVRSGKLICLIGPNGAGKSTLLRTIAGMQKPLSGRVQLNRQDIHRISASQRARLLSVVLTQKMEVGHFTGYAMVAMGRHPYTTWHGQLSEVDHHIVLQAIMMVGAEQLAGRMLHTMSDGERQKIMIARALAQEPELMILDEPTAFLDLPRRVECMHLLRDLAHRSGRTILMSIHDLDLALRSADQIWLLPYHGELQIGIPEDLVLNGALENAFRSRHVRFDMETGAFEAHPAESRRVVLEGDGVQYIWTRHALKREGFTAIAEREPGVPVIRMNSGDKDCWQLITGADVVLCHSLDTLIHALHTHHAAA